MINYYNIIKYTIFTLLCLSLLGCNPNIYPKKGETHTRIPLMGRQNVCVENNIIHDIRVITEGFFFARGIVLSGFEVKVPEDLQKWIISTIDVKKGQIFRYQQEHFNKFIDSALKDSELDKGRLYKVYFSVDYDPYSDFQDFNFPDRFPNFKVLSGSEMKKNIHMEEDSDKWFYIKKNTALDEVEFFSRCIDTNKKVMCTAYIFESMYFGSYIFEHALIEDWEYFHNKAKKYLAAGIKECDA